MEGASSDAAETAAAANVLAGEIAELLKQRKTVKAELVELNTKLSTLAEQIKIADNAHRDLTVEVATMGKKKQELEKQYSDLESNSKELAKELQEYKLELEKHKDVDAERNAILQSTRVDLQCDGAASATSDPNALTPMLGPCMLTLVWKQALPGSSYTPKRFYIVRKGSNSLAFEKVIGNEVSTITLPAGTWHDPSKVQLGQEYYAFIEYQHAKSESIPFPVKVLHFKVDRTPWAAQVTAKVYTAWRRGRGDESDQAFIVPGIAAGGAYRFGDRSSDEDIIGLRVVGAVGPNLVSNARIVEDEDGNQTVQSRQSLQIILGAELVVSKYFAIGPAWVVSGSESGGPAMILLTYGELYPAVSTN